jgi:hypothetical protein
MKKKIIVVIGAGSIGQVIVKARNRWLQDLATLPSLAI